MKKNIPLSKIPMNNEIKKSVTKVLENGNYILGKYTQEFERKFARFSGTKYGACVSSGTAALFLSLKNLGVKKGDEIIIPSLSFVATATPILMCGAIPKFVEINSQNYTIDPLQIEKAITRKTKGIIAVHLYGHPADMDPINDIAKKKSLFVLEDAAQAHGAQYKKQKIGGLANASCFSFYPSKNLTVGGDGGIILSDNKEFIEKIKMLRNHGRTQKYIHEILGYNLRFNEIQAVIGINMLKHLKKYNRHRRKIAKIYDDVLKDVTITPIEEKWAYHVFHMYTIRTKNRNELKEFLWKNKIASGIHYPVPIHKQPIFKKFTKMKMQFTDEVCNTTLSLPMHPLLKTNEAEYIAKKTRTYFK